MNTIKNNDYVVVTDKQYDDVHQINDNQENVVVNKQKNEIKWVIYMIYMSMILIKTIKNNDYVNDIDQDNKE